LIKTVLTLENEVLPPHRALNELNPKIDLSTKISLEAVPWSRDAKTSRVDVVWSFGITGTDTHVIIEEAPGPKVKVHKTQ